MCNLLLLSFFMNYHQSWHTYVCADLSNPKKSLKRQPSIGLLREDRFEILHGISFPKYYMVSMENYRHIIN